MAKKQHIFNHIWLDWLKTNIYWIICSQEEYKRRIKLEFGETCKLKKSVGGRFEVYTNGDRDIGVIWIKSPRDLRVVAHECFHAVHWILADRSIKLSYDSDEAFSYLLEHLIGEILKLNKK